MSKRSERNSEPESQPGGEVFHELYERSNRTKTPEIASARVSECTAKWASLFQTLCPAPQPDQAEWRSAGWQKLDDIRCVLQSLCRLCGQANYSFLPGGGGFTLSRVHASRTPGCLGLYAERYWITAKPSSLAVFVFPKAPAWSYLDLAVVSPGTAVTRPWVDDERPSKLEGGYRPQFSERGNQLLAGRVVIFSMAGPYNSDPGTTDGRHDHMSREGFHRYILEAVRQCGSTRWLKDVLPFQG